MTSIAEQATRDVSQSDRMLSARHELTAYECYESAVEMFDEQCFDISQVCQHTLLADTCW